CRFSTSSTVPTTKTRISMAPTSVNSSGRPGLWRARSGRAR
ncbi:MAG: hypothetical protein AVDCRST_MAG24-1537, partial [uncultured Nocardioidaceae bacterium]